VSVRRRARSSPARSRRPRRRGRSRRWRSSADRARRPGTRTCSGSRCSPFSPTRWSGKGSPSFAATIAGGRSTGGSDQDTTETLAGDGRAMLRWLSARPEADPARTGLLGHSEGTIAAGLTALGSEDRPDFLVLLAAPGVTGEALLLAQAERLSRAAGVPDEAIAANAALQRKLFAAARSGEGWDAVRRRSWRRSSPRSPPLPPTTVTRWPPRPPTPRWRWRGPLDALVPRPRPRGRPGEGLRAGVRGLGGRDLQVPADQSRPPLEKALAGKPGSTVRIFPEANHLFQSAKTGGIEEYGVLPKAFVPGLPDQIATWILARGLDTKLSE